MSNTIGNTDVSVGDHHTICINSITAVNKVLVKLRIYFDVTRIQESICISLFNKTALNISKWNKSINAILIYILKGDFIYVL